VRRKIAIVLALVLALGLLAACNSGSSDNTNSGGNTNTSPPPAGGGNDAPPANSEEPWADRPEVTLILAGHDPDHSLPGQYTFAWAEAVFQESRGRIKIEVNNGGTIAGPTEVLDVAKSGVADLAFGLPSFFPGQFPMTDMLIMPYMPFETSVQASEAFWNIWSNTNLLQSDPGYSGVRVIMLRANCDTPIITANRKLNSANDLQGMTMRATIAPLVRWLGEFNATGQGCPIGELFQNLQNGAFDGALTDWHAIYSYRLYDNCAKYFADEKVQWNMYFFVMNESSYNRLSAENKAVIDRLSGPGAFAIMRDAWDDLTIETQALVLAESGNEIYHLPAAEAQRLRDAAERTNSAYVETLGEPGRQLWEAFSALFPR